jgi:hypothetical protein
MRFLAAREFAGRAEQFGVGRSHVKYAGLINGKRLEQLIK